MKKILSLVLVLSMVLGSFGFAFAAEEVVPDSVKRVHAAGLFGVGGLELDRIATRAELATLVLRLHGYEDAEIEALKTASNFSDVAATSWYAPYVGLAVQEGLFTGDTGANTFRPLENAKYAELLVVILRALGYGEDLAGLAWPNGYVLKAAEVGIDVDLTKDANSTVSRLVVGATIDKALDLEVKGGEETLGQKLGLEGFEPVEPEPEELEIVGVSTDNLKQVVVEFNQELEENEDIENVKNYTLENDKGRTLSAIKDVEIVGDTAVLTLEKAVDNQTDAVLVVDKKVFGKELELDVKFDDFTIPTVEHAEVIGESTIKVVFSEPMNPDTLNTRSFEVKSEDGKTTHHVRRAVLVKNDVEAEIELRSKLKDGDLITLTVNNSLKDYAEFRIAKTEIDLEVIEDDSEIEVIGFRKASEEGITLILNKNVKSNQTRKIEDNYYHTSRRNKVNTVPKFDGNEITLEFTDDNELPTGTAYIFIDAEALVDYWGNVNKQTIRFEAEITADTKAPAISGSISAKDGDRTLTVNFDKRLDKKTAEDERNYTIVNESSGKEAVKVRRARLSNDDKVVTLTLDEGLKAGKYILEVNDVEDLRGNATADLEKSFTVEGEALSLKKVEATASYDSNKREYKILVDFGRSMNIDDDRYGAHLLENYSINVQETGKAKRLMTLAELADKTGFYVDVDLDSNTEVAEITIERSSSAKYQVFLEPDDQDEIVISRLMDANDVLTQEASATLTLKKAVMAFGIDKVEAVAIDEIKVTFDKNIYTFDENDIVVTTEAYSDARSHIIEISSISWDKDKEVRIYLEKDLGTDAKFGTAPVYVYVRPNTGTYTQHDERLEGRKNYDVDDKISPEFDDEYDRSDFRDGVKIETIADKTVATLKFTEAVNFENGALGAFKFSGNGKSIDSRLITVAEGQDDEIIVTFDKVYNDVTIELENETKLFADGSGNAVKTFHVDVTVK